METLSVKERGILFSAPMVRALLDDRKTQTRRVVKKWHFTPGNEGLNLSFSGLSSSEVAPGFWRLTSRGAGSCWEERAAAICPYGRPGDRLWVKEAWQATWHQAESANMHVSFAADGSEIFFTAPESYALPKVAQNPENLITPLFMPRWASRITLEITEVRVQRLHDITEADAIAEGIVEHGFNTPYRFNHHSSTEMSAMLASGHPVSFEETARDGFLKLWESINGHESVVANPWVWAVTFKRLEAPHA